MPKGVFSELVQWATGSAPENKEAHASINEETYAVG